MYLFIGLGNPGEKFLNNRHNVGFMIIDAIASRYNFPNFKKKSNSYVTLKILNSKKVILLKPNTYMNDSGLSALNIKMYYNLHNEHIYVFHDEIDLKASKIKIKTSGGHNGHNGLKSLDNHIGRNYHRIRIGIGRPSNKLKNKNDDIVSKWVLSDFSSSDRQLWLNSRIDRISDCFEDLLDKNFNSFLMNI